MITENDKKAINCLESGKSYWVYENLVGKAVIWKVFDVFVLFSVSKKSGKAVYEDTYSDRAIDSICSTIDAWRY